MLVALDNITMEQEVPSRLIVQEPRWTENYCFIGYDPVTHVGMYLHIGRWLQDPSVWREEVYIYLPDGKTLNYRSIGAGNCDLGPSGALSHYQCREPGVQWDMTFNGPTNLLDRETLLKGSSLPERPMKRMTMDATFRNAGPIMMYEIEDNSSIGRWHYEQEMLVSASITYDGTTYTMKNGQAWRDHTRGPRYLGNVHGHINAQGRLADGRFFSLFRIWENRDGTEIMTVNEARVIHDGKATPARVLEATRFRSVDELDDPFHLLLDVGGEQIALTGRPLNLLAYSCTPEYEVLYGLAPEAAPFVCFNQPFQFSHADQIIYGNVERSLLF